MFEVTSNLAITISDISSISTSVATEELKDGRYSVEPRVNITMNNGNVYTVKDFQDIYNLCNELGLQRLWNNLKKTIAVDYLLDEEYAISSFNEEFMLKSLSTNKQIAQPYLRRVYKLTGVEITMKKIISWLKNKKQGRILNHLIQILEEFV